MASLTEDMTMRVTSVQLHQKLGETIDAAQREPVVVTKHDRPHVVIVSAAYYDFLQTSLRRARLTSSLTPEEVACAQAATVPSEAEQQLFLQQFSAALNADLAEAL
jgi:prevent-host-death family protein